MEKSLKGGTCHVKSAGEMGWRKMFHIWNRFLLRVHFFFYPALFWDANQDGKSTILPLFKTHASGQLVADLWPTCFLGGAG